MKRKIKFTDRTNQGINIDCFYHGRANVRTPGLDLEGFLFNIHEDKYQIGLNIPAWHVVRKQYDEDKKTLEVYYFPKPSLHKLPEDSGVPWMPTVIEFFKELVPKDIKQVNVHNYFDMFH